MNDRQVLPQRRASFTFDIYDASGRIDLTVSYSTFETGGVAEIFVTARKIGSDMEAIARDSAILLSLALQYGCPFDTIKHALTRNRDGTAQSLMGRIIDRVVERMAKGTE